MFRNIFIIVISLFLFSCSLTDKFKNYDDPDISNNNTKNVSLEKDDYFISLVDINPREIKRVVNLNSYKSFVAEKNQSFEKTLEMIESIILDKNYLIVINIDFSKEDSNVFYYSHKSIRDIDNFTFNMFDTKLKTDLHSDNLSNNIKFSYIKDNENETNIYNLIYDVSILNKGYTHLKSNLFVKFVK
jgi:hypothetical protein